MKIDIVEKRRKTKLIGIRLYREEYDAISRLAREKKASRSFIAESLLRAALTALRQDDSKK
jgi:hypothetical protein